MALARKLLQRGFGTALLHKGPLSGSNGLKRIVALALDQEQPYNSSQMEAFQQQHGLSNEQFTQIEDLLSVNLQTAENMCGWKFPHYEEHLWMKLRRAKLPMKKTVRESVENLNQMYPGIEQAIAPSESEVALVRKLSAVLIMGNNTERIDVSSFDKHHTDALQSKINQLEQMLLKEDVTEDKKVEYQMICAQMRAQLENDFVSFVTDNYCWMDRVLNQSGQRALLPKNQQPIDRLSKATDTALSQLETNAQDAQLEKVAAANKERLKVYNNEDEQFAQVVAANHLERPYYNLIQTGLAVGFTSWGYMLWMAQSSYLSLAVVPAALYYTKLYNETRAHYNMETVKDIYYRKDDNTLDIYLWKEGNYSRVIEGISIGNVQICNNENTVLSSTDSLPKFMPTFKGLSQQACDFWNNVSRKENSDVKSMTLAELRRLGLPTELVVMNIEGKSYFIHQDYMTNSALAERLGVEM